MSAQWKTIAEFVENGPVFKAGTNADFDKHVAAFLDTVPLQALLTGLAQARQEEHDEAARTIIAAIRLVFDSKEMQQHVLSSGFKSILLDGLKHAEVEIRRITVENVKRVELEKFPKETQEELLEGLAHSLADKDTTVGLGSIDAILQYCTSPDRVNKVAARINRLVLEISEDKGVDSSSAMLRTFHLVASLASKSEENVMICKQTNTLNPLLQLIGGNDVLLQLNAINLIPLVAVTDAGFMLLQESNVIERLSAMAGLKENHQSAALLGDYALRVMSQLCARSLSAGLKNENTLKMTTNFLNIVENRMEACLDSRDPTEATTLMLTVGFFTGTQPEISVVKILERDELVAKWMDLANVHGERFFIGGLESIAKALRGGCVLLPEEKYHGADELDRMEAMSSTQYFANRTDHARQTAGKLGKDIAVAYSEAYARKRGKSSTTLIDVLFDTAALPMDEMRCAAFAVLRCIAGQEAEWGLQAIFSHPNSTSFLFNRALEMSKIAKEWRFSVIEAAYQNPKKDILGDVLVQKMLRFLKQGPFKGPPQKEAQVLLETA